MGLRISLTSGLLSRRCVARESVGLEDPVQKRLPIYFAPVIGTNPLSIDVGRGNRLVVGVLDVDRQATSQVSAPSPAYDSVVPTTTYPLSSVRAIPCPVSRPLPPTRLDHAVSPASVTARSHMSFPDVPVTTYPLPWAGTTARAASENPVGGWRRGPGLLRDHHVTAGSRHDQDETKHAGNGESSGEGPRSTRHGSE